MELWLNTLAKKIAIVIGLVCLAGFSIFPFYWMVKTSVSAGSLLFVWPPQFLPTSVSVEPYIKIVGEGRLVSWLINSTLLAVATATVATTIAALTAYAISRFQFAGRNAVQFTLLLTQLFPGILVAMPIYVIFARLGWLNSLSGLGLAYMGFLVPVAAALLKSFFDAVPVELEEASMMDGSSRFGAFIRITLPLAMPGLVSTFFFCAIICWDEFLFARLMIRSPDLWTISLGLASYSGQFVTPWDQVMAAASIATLPAVLLFFILQRYLVTGLTAGAIKG
jgi:ABC-type glycerol-3-phosphate transport system permease component